MDRVDLIVIGGGPGGYLAAQRAAEGGMRVVLFEKNRLGGICLNEGCIPTKTLLNSVKIYEQTKKGSLFGVSAEKIAFDHRQVLERKKKVVNTLVSGIGMTMKKKRIQVVYEAAMILGKCAEGFEVQAGGVKYISKNILLATGSEALIPPIMGNREAMISGLAVTSREMLEDEEIPEKLIIIGAGVIGLELASYFSSLGTEVSIIEVTDRIAGKADPDVEKLLRRELEKKGIRFFLQCRATRFTENGMVYEKEGVESVIAADKILLATGRKPALENIGIENVGLFPDKGRIVTNEYMQTSVENLYAVGDVTGQSMLAHTAYRESEAAVHHMLGIEDRMDYIRIPSIIYTVPEIACIGETEESAKQKGIDVKTAKLPMSYSGRFVAETEGMAGICKVVMDQITREIIGVHLVGTYVSEMIWGMAGLMEKHVTVDEIQKIIFPHPTVSEIIKETTAVLLK